MFPHDAAAAWTEPGGALFLPRQGLGRVDNPDLYGVLYASDAAAGAAAEAFNVGEYRQVWTSRMLRPRGRARRHFAIATYELTGEDLICDLDDPARLLRHALRPSEVITRNRKRTQGWARAIFNAKRHGGVRWWSYHDARWGSIGLWNIAAINKNRIFIEPLNIENPALEEAANVLSIELRRRVR